MDNLTGIARLGAKRHGLELSFDYWQSNEGTIAGKSFALTQLSSGLYEAANEADARDKVQPDRVPDQVNHVDTTEAVVFFMDPDLGSLAKQVQGKWQHVDSLVGMMHATRHLRSATCILLFQKNSQLRQLAETVHTLRLTIGRHAHIVLQEKDASLRYQNEALLLKLGLSLVVNRDVPASRLPLLLQSLQGQIFNRDVDINFEAALASVLPTQLHGYLLPPRFVQEVATILARCETLNVPCALMIGRPAQGVPMKNLMVSNQISRPGDLITADADNCFVFLSACPQPVLLNTLERLLGSSVDLAFASVRFAVTAVEIQTELAALSRAATRDLLPDYTNASTMPAEVAASGLNTPPPEVNVFPLQARMASTPKAVTLLFPQASIQTPERLDAIATEFPQTRRLSTQAGRPSQMPDFDAEESLFDYDTESDETAFRKNDAPRALRAVSKNK